MDLLDQHLLNFRQKLVEIMNPCEMNTIYTPNRSNSPSPDRIRRNARGLTQSISICNISTIANVVRYILADSEVLFEALKRGPIIDMMGREIDQGIIFEELTYLANDVREVGETIELTLSADRNNDHLSGEITLLNGKREQFSECLCLLCDTARKMETFILPNWTSFPQTSNVVTLNPFGNGAYRLVSPLTIETNR